MPTYTYRPWWTVEDAAQLLRINKHTLYRAIAADDFPHQRIGTLIKIPAEALRLTVHPTTQTRTYHVEHDNDQLMLDLGPIVPVRRFRNGGVIKPFHYEAALYSPRQRSRH